MKRRCLCAAAAAAVGALAGAAPARAAATDLEWHDARRARALPLRVRWPAGDAACAAIVHSHGLGGSREGGDVWGRAWQAAGFAVLHLQHPGSDLERLRSGGVAGLRDAASAAQLFERVADVRFALDEIARRAAAGEPGWARLRQQPVGASGHSFGATTVQALAGQRAGARGPAGEREPRLRALLALSPWPAPRGATLAFDSEHAPLLMATGSLDSDALGRGIEGRDRATVYDAAAPGRRALLWLDGADHATFGGNRDAPGGLRRRGAAPALQAQHHAHVIAASVLWWRAWLLDDASARAALREPPALGPLDRWRID